MLLILGATFANAQADGGTIEIGQRHTMHSEAIGEERTFYVNLPDSYDDQIYAPQNYPVLFVLDGDPYFETVSGIVHFMSSAAMYTFQMPEVIIVGMGEDK